MSSPDMSAETQGTAIQEREPKPRASFQFVMSPSEVEKLHGALYVAPQAEIYNGQFIDPFSSLVMIVAKRQNQLVMQAEVEVDESFNLRYGSTIGDSEALKTLQKRYPQHQLSGDGTTFIALRKDQPVGVIQRVDEDRIIVRRGANAGPITLSEDHPVNDLKMEMDQFLLLTQRYVTSLMQASDGNHREVNLVLDLPQLTEGALATYYSSFEIMAREFRARHRTLDLATEIGGFEKVKTVMRSLFIDLTDPDTSRKFGNQPFSNRFVLITGAHGTGKSLFPKALDTMLSDRFGKNFEHFRLPLNDMLRKYGGSTATIVNTILDHIRENERKGITTALHIDNLEALCPPDEQAGHAVLVKHMQINEPVVTAIREFGNDLGQHPTM